jgi:ATP-binding cassette, subfamily B, bacterial MsbA
MPVYTRLLKYMLRFWPPFLLGVLGTILGSGTDAAFTWFLKPLINKGFIGKDPIFIHYLPFIILTAFLLRGVASFLADYFLARVGRQVVKCFREDLFSKFLYLPAKHYDKSTTGEMLSLMLYNVEQIAKSSTTTLIMIVRELCLILGLCYVMFSNSWRLTLIFLLTAPLIALIVVLSSRRMRGLSKNVQGTMADITHFAEEAISGNREIKSFGGQAYETRKFSDAVYKNFQSEMSGDRFFRHLWRSNYCSLCYRCHSLYGDFRCALWG